MATPRVFISSTCYDLKEIRFQIRSFIEDIGYEPVMSDFGDIFYDFNDHVQDSCTSEIEKSNLFVLIIGNNYGSVYHKHDDKKIKVPDSVTLQEFKTALDTGIPKYIFINKFVQYDYDNYERALSKYLHEQFSKKEIPSNEIEDTRFNFKKDFNATYPFPNDAYKYIFYFIEIIKGLELNNAIYSFESFDNIKNDLRKQWAGLLYNSLKNENTVGIEKIHNIESKIDKIENYLKTFTQNETINNKITFNIDQLTHDINIENIHEIKNKLHTVLNDITTYSSNDLFEGSVSDNRFYTLEKFDKVSIKKFIQNSKRYLEEYKWSNTIPLEKLFGDIKLYNHYHQIKYSIILDFITLINSIDENELENLYTTITGAFNLNYRKTIEETQDEIPF